MPEDKKKKVKVRPGYNPRTNAMTNRRKGEPAGSGTRKGKATRGGQTGERKETKIGKFFSNAIKGIDIEKWKKDYPEEYQKSKKEVDQY